MNTILRISRACVVLLAIIYPAYAFAATDSLKNSYEYKPSGGGFSFGGGAVYGLPVKNLSSVISSNIGYQVQAAWLKKRFAIEGCVSGFSSASNRDITLGAENIVANTMLDFYTVGIQASYSVVYTESWRVSPLTGPAWSALTLENEKHPDNQFTWVAGTKVQYNFRGRSNLGGLKDGLVLPIYFKYLYSFPTELTTNVTGGAHFLSVGLELYIKSPDE